MHTACRQQKDANEGVEAIVEPAKVVVINGSNQSDVVVIKPVDGSHQVSRHGKYSDAKARLAYQLAWQRKRRAAAKV